MPAGQVRFAHSPYEVAAAERLRDALGVSRTVGSILARRGLGDPAAAREFLEAGDRHDPFAIAGMEAACDLILDHIGRRSRILVFGDYDVDGVSSTAIALNALRAAGAEPAWELPSRHDEGYGLSQAAVERLAAQGVGLLLTVDCGVTAVAEVAAARAAGMDVLVTDHHRPGPELPDCPLLHPAIGGYPFPELCAAGVALKLSEALRARAGLDPAGAEEDLDLAALATVCDLVPLRGENRRIVRAGLARMARTRKPGLRALMAQAGVDPARVDEHSLGFRLGPRLNAAGRLRRADPALELLTTEDDARAAAVAEELDGMNHERRDTELRILREAERACLPQLHQAVLVVAGEGWHAGVVGIVASRLVELHSRPAVVIAMDGEGGRGSGRSISAYDLHAGLHACAGHLNRFGGHRMAAGLELAAEAVEPFRRALAAHVGAALAPEDLVREERVDAVVPGGVLGLGLAEELQRLAPFGMGNPRPVLLVPGARIAMATAMGQERDHARFTLENGGAKARGVAFRTSAASLARLGDRRHDLALTLERNEWNGTIEPRVLLRAFSPTGGGPCEVLEAAGSLWDALDGELAAPLEPPEPEPGAPTRGVCDSRGQGIAGVVGDLLSSGDEVLVVTADGTRRRDGVGALLGGLAGGRLALVDWETLLRSPGLAGAWPHLVALDPPLMRAPDAWLAGLPSEAAGSGFAHLVWGPAEVEFARAVARAGLELRPALVACYRALRDGPEGAEALAAALAGRGAHPLPHPVCGRILRILVELKLVSYTPGARGEGWRLLDAAPTSLEHSRAYRAYAARLQAAEDCLSECLTATPRAATA